MALTDEDKRWIADRLEEMGTKLSTALHQWASSSEARQRYSSELRKFEVQIEDLQDRVKRLERKRGEAKEPPPGPYR